MSVVSVGPLPNNSEAVLRLVFGSNVSVSKVVESARKSTLLKKECGLISNEEASSIVLQLEEKLKEAV